MGAPGDFDWQDLVEAIRETSVVPIIGSEMRLLEQDGEPRTVEHWCLQHLPQKLNLENSSSIVTLNQLALQILEGVPLSKKERRKRRIARTMIEVFEEHPPPLPATLLKLAAIADLNLFITTAVDTLLEQAIEEVRGVPCLTMSNSLTAGVDDFDSMEPPAQPCVYHLFGAMPRGEDYAGTDIAITEEDKLEYLQQLGDNANKPRNLLDFLNDEDAEKELMFLGCNLTNGVTKLMLRTLADCRLFPEKFFKYVRSRDQVDERLRMFLEGLNSELLLPEDSREFAEQMHASWKNVAAETGAAGDTALLPAAKRSKRTDVNAEGFVFVSYRRADKSAVKRLVDSLEPKMKIWWDDDMESGFWENQIETKIEDCALFIPVLSRRGQEPGGSIAKKEWNMAIERRQNFSDDETFIIPLIIDDLEPNAEKIPSKLWKEQVYGCQDGDMDATVLNHIVAAYRNQIKSRQGGLVMTDALPESRSSKTLDNNNPFPGLRYFDEDESEFFIGRDTEVKELKRRIRRDALTVLFGVSGLGKTSLLLAGVFPDLRDAGYLPVRLRVEFHAGADAFAEQVIKQFRSAAKEHGVETSKPKPGESLWEYFHRAESWGPRNRLLQPVLVLDQFEEIFSLGVANNDARIEPFVVELADLIENRVPKRDRRRISATEDLPYSLSKQPYRVVLSMREDFLPELEAWHRQIPSIRSNRFRLRPMNGSAALKVVTQVPDRVADDLAEDIVRYVAADKNGETPLKDLKIEPALLSVVCRELNRRRIDQGLDTITRGLLQVASKNVLRNLYEDCLDKFPDVRLTLQKAIENDLLTDSGMRDSVADEKFLDKEKGITEEVLQELVEERLIRVEERSGVRRVELTHDLWTGVVQQSRDRRQRREKAQQREQERVAALEAEREEARARAERELASRKKLRRTFAWSGVAAVVLIAAVSWTALTLREQSQTLRQQQSFLDEALKEVQTVNREFVTVQSAIDSLGESIGELDPIRVHVSRLGSSAGAESVTVPVDVLKKQFIAVSDDVSENFQYLKGVSDRFDKDSEDAQQIVDAQQADSPNLQDPGEVSADATSPNLPPVDELEQYYASDLAAVQSVLSVLESAAPDLSSGNSPGLLGYLAKTSLSVWTGEEMQRAFALLDSSNSGPAQIALSHINLAAFGFPNDDFRQRRALKIRRTFDKNETQIKQTLQALDDNALNPTGRYNALWYLSETDLSTWTPNDLTLGCRIARDLLANQGVGTSTKNEAEKMQEFLPSCS